MFQRKRRVRLHLKPGCGIESVEGIMRGRKPVGDSYVLELPKVLKGDAGRVEEFTLDVLSLEVRADETVMREVLSR